MINEVVISQTTQQTLSEGAQVTARADRTKGVKVSDSYARYMDAVLRGNVFLAANQAGIAATAGLSATSTVFTLFNPAGSGKNLVLLDILIALTAIPAAVVNTAYAIWLVANVSPTQAAPTGTSALTVRNALIGGGGNGIGQAFSTATLAASPVVIRQLACLIEQLLGAPTTGGPAAAASLMKDEVAGSIIVPPGIYISVQASAALTIAASMTWEEVPI